MKYTVRKEEGILNSKVGKFLQLLIIVFLSVLAVLAFKPLQSTIYASSYNGSQSDTANGGGGSWGNTNWNYSQVGYRVYLYNPKSLKTCTQFLRGQRIISCIPEPLSSLGILANPIVS